MLGRRANQILDIRVLLYNSCAGTYYKTYFRVCSLKQAIVSSSTYFKDETHQGCIKQHDDIMTTAERHAHVGTSFTLEVDREKR